MMDFSETTRKNLLAHRLLCVAAGSHEGENKNSRSFYPACMFGSAKIEQHSRDVINSPGEASRSYLQ
jgi:hypothetical protein